MNHEINMLVASRWARVKSLKDQRQFEKRPSSANRKKLECWQKKLAFELRQIAAALGRDEDDSSTERWKV